MEGIKADAALYYAGSAAISAADKHLLMDCAVSARRTQKIYNNMIDTYGRTISYLRLSVTDLCDLRCRYCMPDEGICKKSHEEMLTEDEMISIVRAAASLGINKVRITGGEPLVKKNILSICTRISQIPGIEQLCITTNAVRLAEMAQPLKEAGVDRINISLDTLDPEKYRFLTRRGNIEDALRGLKAAISAGFDKIKINTVLIGGINDDEICDLAALTMQYPVDVRFIELMPMYDSGDFGPEAYISADRVLEVMPMLEPVRCNLADQMSGMGAQTAKVMTGRTDEQGSKYNLMHSHAMGSSEMTAEDNTVARLFKLPGAQGYVGLINPVSNHFCASCNRLRITADGHIKPCLHKEAEYSIKGMNEADMKLQLMKAIEEKPKWHGVLSAQNRSHAGRCMNQIGG